MKAVMCAKNSFSHFLAQVMNTQAVPREPLVPLQTDLVSCTLAITTCFRPFSSDSLSHLTEINKIKIGH